MHALPLSRAHSSKKNACTQRAVTYFNELADRMGSHNPAARLLAWRQLLIGREVKDN